MALGSAANAAGQAVPSEHNQGHKSRKRSVSPGFSSSVPSSSGTNGASRAHSEGLPPDQFLWSKSIQRGSSNGRRSIASISLPTANRASGCFGRFTLGVDYQRRRQERNLLYL